VGPRLRSVDPCDRAQARGAPAHGAPGARLGDPLERKRPQRTSPKLTPEIKAFIGWTLESDRTAPRKQRHTARRIWQRVTEERGADVAESTLRAHVRQRRRELGLGVWAYVPQHHEVARSAETDFYEADIDFPWRREKAHIISLGSEFSGPPCTSPTRGQTSALCSKAS
jgi:hypothetical protein